MVYGQVPLEADCRLEVEIIRVARPECRGGKRLLDVIAREEVAVASLQQCPARDRVPRYQVDFISDKAAVIRVDSIARSGSRGNPAACGPGRGVEIIVCIGQPERMAFQRNSDLLVRLGLKD